MPEIYMKTTTLARALKDFYHVGDPHMVIMLCKAMQSSWDEWCRQHHQSIHFANEGDSVVCALPTRLVWDFLRTNLALY